MEGRLCILLHAHLPFVRHLEHETFLEEAWLFEALTEAYLPLLRMCLDWERDGVDGPLALTISPTLCAMLQDRCLQERYARYLESLLALAEKELQRTHFEPAFQRLAGFYFARLRQAREFYERIGRDVPGQFRGLEQRGRLELITTSATHALLPFLADQPNAARAQVLVARDAHRAAFHRSAGGFWLPECAFAPGIDEMLAEGGFRWFVVETHGLLHARPCPVYAACRPILTPAGVAAFARDPESARQVWSRNQGYPGDEVYRDFYRDIGFDLEWDYVAPHLLNRSARGFTGFKYYRITGGSGPKQVYDPARAAAKAREHARHFLQARAEQFGRLGKVMDRAPVLMAPYDAELFGHWWYEGPEFIDAVVRGSGEFGGVYRLTTPGRFLAEDRTHQVAMPASSSWGEAGYWRTWLNEDNEWIFRACRQAQARMRELVARLTGAHERAVRQAARELLLAQASDWPFIIRAGTSPEYARQRVREHLENFWQLARQVETDRVSIADVTALEQRHPVFSNLDLAHWSGGREPRAGGAQLIP